MKTTTVAVAIALAFCITFHTLNLVSAEGSDAKHSPPEVVSRIGERKSAPSSNTTYIQKCGKRNTQLAESPVAQLNSTSTKVPSGSHSPEPFDRASRDLQVKTLLEKRCAICHRPGEEQGKGGGEISNILDIQELISKDIIKPGNPSDSLLFSALNSNSMPKTGPKFTLEEKQLIKDWISSLKSDSKFPNSTRNSGDTKAEILSQSEALTTTKIGPINQSDVEACMNKDLQGLPEEDRTSIRYFDLTHFYNVGKTAEIATATKALNKLVNSLSWKRQITNPVTIDPTGTLLRIDIRDYQWSPELWEKIALVNEFPFGPKSPAGKEVNLKTGTTTPLVRGDWFVTNASQTSLYHEILYVDPTNPKKAFDRTGMESRLEAQLRVDTGTVQDISDKERLPDVVQIGFEKSNVARHNRILQRFNTPFGAYWKSADFDDNQGEQNIFQNPINAERKGGEMIFSLPNGLMGFLITDNRGNALQKAPTKIVLDPTRPKDEYQVVNGLSCLNCHQSGYKRRKDEVRDHVLITAKEGYSEEEKRQVKRVYRDPSVMDKLINADQKQYEQALKETGLKPTDPDPIAATVERFEGPVDDRQIAVELGTTVDNLHEVLKKDPALNRRLGLHAGGEIDRTRLRAEFENLKSALSDEKKQR